MIARILEVLRAPRRLRELGVRHDELRRRFQLEKLAAKREVVEAKARAELLRQRLCSYQDQASRVRELEDRLEKLREENGENYRRYVRVQHSLDQLRNQHCRNTPYGGCP